MAVGKGGAQSPTEGTGRLRLSEIPTPVRVKPAAHAVDTFEQEVDVGADNRALSRTHVVEKSLDIVGKGGDIGETELRGAAFDRVGGSENSVDRLQIGGAFFESHESRFHYLEVLRAFLEEDVEIFGEIGVDAHGTSRMSCERVRPSRGRVTERVSR